MPLLKTTISAAMILFRSPTMKTHQRTWTFQEEWEKELVKKIGVLLDLQQDHHQASE